jgi:threonine/homoserine/homoserine lactone efflux protein
MFMVPTRIWEYVVTAFLIILAPGPTVLFVIARAISWGKASAVASVLGNNVGAFLVSLLIAFGLGPILQSSTAAYISVQVAGGLYLIYLGIQAIRHSAIHAGDMTNIVGSKPTFFQSAKDGFIVGVLNPKVWVFFAAILPQFVDRNKGHVTGQLIFMGAIFTFIAFFSDSTWGVIAGFIRNWLATETKRLVRMRVVGGSVMILLGFFTLWTAIRHH